MFDFLFCLWIFFFFNFQEDGGFWVFVCFVYFNKGSSNSCLWVSCVQYWHDALEVHIWGEKQRRFYVRFKWSRRERKAQAEFSGYSVTHKKDLVHVTHTLQTVVKTCR